MLETIQQYGREKLVGSGEESILRRRHRDWFLALAERAEVELRGPDQRTWFSRLESEHDNLRGAIRWSLESGEAEEGLRLAGALWRFWYVRGYVSEGSGWLEGMMGKSDDVSAPALAKALTGAGILAWRGGDYSRAKVSFEESLSLFRKLGDSRGVAESLRGLGFVARDQGDHSRAVGLFEESLALARETGDKDGIAWPLNDLGVVALNQGDYGRAGALCEESLTLFRESGDKWGSAVSLNILGSAAYYQGDYPRAKELFEESLSLFRELEDKHGTAWCLTGLAGVARVQDQLKRTEVLYKEALAMYRELGHKNGIIWCLESLAGVAGARGQLELAARLFGAAEALRETVGVPTQLSDRADYDRIVASVRAGLGEEAFRAAWEAGRKMTPEEALRTAN